MCVNAFRDRPPLRSRKHNCLQTSTALITRTETISDLCFPFSDFFLPHHWPTNRLCLAFISQRSTGVTTAVAFARPSPPVHVLPTAADMRRRSGSVLGKNSHSFILCSSYSVNCFLLVCMWIEIKLMHQVLNPPLCLPAPFMFFFFFKAVRGSCWRHLQCLCVTGEEVEEAT